MVDDEAGQRALGYCGEGRQGVDSDNVNVDKLESRVV